MNEREAILFIMEELKEARRMDFEMYFELRKQATKRYDELLNRLREIDERDMNPIPPQPPVVTLDKLIPRSSDMTYVDLNVERVATKDPRPVRSGKSPMVDYKELVESIEAFLRDNGPSKLGPIKKAMESNFNVQWKNFNNTLKNAIKYSYHIEITKIGVKDFLYSIK